MAKKLKKPVAKNSSKSTSKSPVKAAKGKPKALPKTAGKSAASKAKPAKASLAKTVVGAMGKLFSKDKSDAKAAKAKTSSVVPAELKSKDKKVKDLKKKNKKGKDGLDMEDDDLLASDEEIGSEEIPDLSEFDENESEEVEVLEESLDEEVEAPKEVKSPDDEIILTDAEGRRYCRVRECDQISAVEGYCRYHYLLLWKKIQVRRKILIDGKLERYVEELTSRYPDKFLEMIRKDLRAEKDFLAAIAELEIDESANENEMEDEAQTFIDEVRGLTPDSGSLSEEEEF